MCHCSREYDRFDEERGTARGRHGRVRRSAEPGSHPGRLPRFRAPRLHREQEGGPTDDGSNAVEKSHIRSAAATQSKYQE